MIRQRTYYQEENKAPIGSRDGRLEHKIEILPKPTYIRSPIVGMEMQTVNVPQNSRHAMKFWLGDNNNKLLDRVVKTSDHLDMYSTKVNRTNARVNIDMQTRRIAGRPLAGVTIPFMWN
jgi:hypothetical protein